MWMPASASRFVVTGPIPHSSSTGNGSRNARSSPGATTTRPLGFATCDATLARCLVVATPTEIGRPISVAHPSTDLGRDLRGGAEQVRRARHVEERLVDRHPLHPWGEVAQHLHHRVTETLVLREVTVDEHEVRAQLARPSSRHRSVHPERLGLVRRRQHDAAADRDRLASQRGIEQLLNRRVEGVEIGMQDRRPGRGCHRAPAYRTSVRRPGLTSCSPRPAIRPSLSHRRE